MPLQPTIRRGGADGDAAEARASREQFADALFHDENASRSHLEGSMP
jgi:hypothetical protein